jgi:hypothetical protein
MPPLGDRMRARFRGSASKGVVHPDNRLAFLDQATFLSARANGRAQLVQAVWVYRRAVDFDGLRRLNRNLGDGLLGRRIERSPLPFGRHRWVTCGPPLDIDVADHARPRAEVSDWADECAQLPIDPELGPGWRMSVLPLTDGSTAVSLVVSHNLVDGTGAAAAIIDAVNGNVRDFGYPPPRSRGRWPALVSDARETVRGAPEVARAVAAAVKLLRSRQQDTARPAAPPPAAGVSGGADCDVVVPTISICIDLADWDARTKALGGAGYSLLAGFSAKLGERMGRSRADDGTITLLVPIADRTTMEDTRANAISFETVIVDPAQVTKDLSGVQKLLVDAWYASRETSDETGQLLVLTPFVPKRALKLAADQLFGFTALPVICSNLGELPPEAIRPDGTEAEHLMLRGVDQNVTRKYIESVNGQLVVAGGRLAGKMFISVVGYQRGGINTKPHLRELADETLKEFGLSGTLE